MNFLSNRRFYVLVTLLLFLLLSSIEIANDSPAEFYFGILFLCLNIVFIFSSVARCRSIGWSGWRVLSLFLPGVGAIFIFLLMVTPNTNRTPTIRTPTLAPSPDCSKIDLC